MAQPPSKQSPERELAEVLATELAQRERRTARDLLLSEHRGVTRLRKAVRRANDAVVATAASRDDERETVQHVRRAASTLQADLHHAAAISLGDARAAGRVGLEREVERELPAIAMAAEDEAAAVAASQTLAGAWSSTSLAAIAARGDTGLAKAISGVPEMVDGRVRRTAATEVARSFNDERSELLISLDDILRTDGGDPQGPGAPPHAMPGLFKVRSEFLDRLTCAQCFGADGETVDANQSFKSGAPPSHPHCRGVVEFIIVPKPERLEDIAIDYQALKAEIQDVIRERREISDRHALSFTSDSLGSKRSPEVLTRRFREEAYATSGPTGGGGRVQFVPPRGGGGKILEQVLRAPPGPSGTGVVAQTQSHPFTPIGQPLSRAFKIGGGRVKAELAEATAAIDSVHGDGDPLVIPVRQVGGKNQHGAILRTRGGDVERMSINAGAPYPRASFLHEAGHYLDAQVLGRRGWNASEDGDAGPLADVMRAIRGTSAHAGLQALSSRKFFLIERLGRRERRPVDEKVLEYVGRPQELFARSYARYIATRSANPAILAELNREHKHVEVLFYKQSWTDADFKPVADAFDALFLRLGWMKPRL